MAGQPPRPATPGTVAEPETLIKWAGIGLVVLAAVFGLGTAISRGWIGPELQLAGATAGGLGLVGGGIRLRTTRRPWSTALVMGGGLVLGLCAAAADAGLGLVSDPVALALLGAVTLGLAVTADRLVLQPPAVAAAAAGLVLPFWILAEGDAGILPVGGLLASIAVGFSALGLLRGWTVTRVVASALGALTLLVLVAASPPPWPSGEAAATLAAALLVGGAAWVGPAVAARLEPGAPARSAGLDHRIVAYLPLWSWAVILIVGDVDGAGRAALIGGGTAVGFAATALVAGSRLPRTLLVTHLLAAGVLALLSLAVYTRGPVLLAAIAVHATVVAVLARRGGPGSPDLWLHSGVLATIAVFWTSAALLRAWAEPVDPGWYLVTLLVVALAAGLGAIGFRLGWVGAGPVAAGAWILGLGWLAGALVHGPQGQAAVSVAWAVAAAGALVVGVRASWPGPRAVGLTSLAVVMAKLLTVDLAAVDTFWRVGLFFVIGMGLLRLAYVLPRLAGAAPVRSGSGDPGTPERN